MNEISEVQIGGLFRFLGLVYTKKGPRLAEDEKRREQVFLDEAEVERALGSETAIT